MNCIQTIIDRQLGNYCRFNYDDILRRLEVDAEESFYGLQRGWAAGGALDSPDPPIFACRFAESAGYEHMLALANEDGRVAIQNTCSPTTARDLEGFQCHNNAVFDLAWMPATMNFVTVSGDHTACLWDVGSGAPRQVSVFCGHSRSVKTVAFRPEGGGVFATGARDGHVLLWDARAPPRPVAAVLRAGGASPAEPPAPAPPVLRPDDTLASCHARCAPRTPGSAGKRARHEPRPVSITGLVFQEERSLLSCGECDGNIKLWDLRKTYGAGRREPLARRALPYPGASAKRGYTHLLLDQARVRLYASCMDDVIYCFNVATYSAAPERRYRGHENATFYIKTSLSPDGAYLVSGSSDKRAYVWNVACAEPVARLAGHRAEVTCAAWARRGDPKIVTCGDDARHMIWRIGRELCDGEAAARAGQCAGRAERAPPPPEPRARPVWGSQERTPTSLKRRAGTPSSRDDKRARGPCDGPPPPARRTKRCLADLMNAAESAGAAKRPRLEEEERLLPAGSKRRMSECATSAESGSGAAAEGRYIAAPADWGYISPPAGASFMTPTKKHSPAACRVLSPRPLPLSPNRLADVPDLSESAARALTFGTPTKDLPDFVRSGEAPHLRLMSPERRRPDRHNWLTRLAEERRGKQEDGCAVESASLKLFSPCSPKENVPLRRSSVSDRTPRAKKPRTLLKYFPVARKE